MPADDQGEKPKETEHTGEEGSTMRTVLFAVWLGAAIVAGPAMAANTSELTPKHGGTLTYMIPADAPPSLDLHREATYALVHAVAPFYSVLMRVNPENPSDTTQFVCDLCTSIPKPTDDGKSYTFKIRTGVKFAGWFAAHCGRRGGELARDHLPAAWCAERSGKLVFGGRFGGSAGRRRPWCSSLNSRPSRSCRRSRILMRRSIRKPSSTMIRTGSNST